MSTKSHTVRDQKNREVIGQKRRQQKERDRVAQAGRKGSLSETKMGRKLTKEWTAETGALIEEWRDACLSIKRPGVRVRAGLAVTSASPDFLAQAAIKAALNSVTAGVSLTSAANELGKSIETQLRIDLFRRKDRRGCKWVSDQIKKRRVRDAHHQHAFYMKVIKDRVADNPALAWDDWSLELRSSVGLKLLMLVSKATQAFEIKMVRHRAGKVMRTKRTIRFTDKGMAKAKVAFAGSLVLPARLPTVVTPRDWEGLTGGGYYGTDDTMVKQPLNGSYEHHQPLLEDGCMDTTQKALNVLQRTPYAINDRVLKVMEHAWSKAWEIGGLPPNEDGALPEYPEGAQSRRDYGKANDIHKAWAKQTRNVHDANHVRMSKRISIEATLRAAREYRSEPAFYFPHQCDFRGRFYPMPYELNPQGSEHSRALLQFATGKPVNDHDAVNWHMVHGANTYGMDKGSMKDRIDWVKEHGDLILKVGRKPLAQDSLEFWTKADKPFMFLAWAIDFWDVYNDKPSHIAVAMDGSCNGLQHFSAMLRDPQAANAVNLQPSELPQDIYQEVADRVNTKLRKAKRKGGQAGFWATEFLSMGVDRKVCKRSVMVMPYGGTLHATRNYVEQECRDRLGEKCNDPTMQKAMSWLAGLVHASTHETVQSAKLAMDWLQYVARIATEKGKHLHWTTPTGFVAHQHYVKGTLRHTQLAGLDNVVLKFSVKKYSDTIAPSESANAIAPNYVHSLDASALAETVVRSGLSSVHMVHDDYGTHAADAQHLATVLREVFVDMYAETNLLVDFKRQIEEQLGVELPDPPEQGSFDVNKVLDSEYFFA